MVSSPLSPLKVSVLLGGVSKEREISLKTGKAVSEALRSLGHHVQEIDVTDENPAIPGDTDFAFICLHGKFGEDGGIQSILTDKKIPFNGAGAEASKTAMNKVLSKEKMTAAGIPVPEGASWETGMQWKIPYIIKPVDDGSSIGLFIVKQEKERLKADEEAASLNRPMMIESMVQGREFTISILGDRALPLIEIKPKEGTYDYKNKYTPGSTEYLCPAPLNEELSSKMQQAALEAHRSIGCDVYSRVDFMLDESSRFYALEINTIPGMTATSLLPKAALKIGLDFPRLCQEIIDLSMKVQR